VAASLVTTVSHPVPPGRQHVENGTFVNILLQQYGYSLFVRIRPVQGSKPNNPTTVTSKITIFLNTITAYISASATLPSTNACHHWGPVPPPAYNSGLLLHGRPVLHIAVPYNMPVLSRRHLLPVLRRLPVQLHPVPLEVGLCCRSLSYFYGFLFFWYMMILAQKACI